MQTGSSDIMFRGHRSRVGLKLSKRNVRKSRHHRFDLEGLESRTLLATTPAPATTGAPLQNLSAIVGNGGKAQEDSPIVAVDPLDPNKVVTVWVNNDTADIGAPGPQVFVEGEYSVNGGSSWATFQAGVVLGDPNTTNPTVPYLQMTSPSLGFDRSGNFYVMVDEHNAGSSSGAIVLEKYNFTGDAPVAVRFHQPGGGSAAYNIVYQWLPADDLAFNPTMAVDDNIASFTDPTTGEVQTDTGAGNIYIAWTTQAVAPVLVSANGIPFADALFNPNVINMITSTDGGQNFNAPVVQDVPQPNLNGLALYGPTTERDAQPAITISQGRLPDESGLGGDAGVPGGQVTLGWVDTAANQHQVLVNSVSPGGQALDFNGTGGFITPGTKNGVSITDFPVTVQIPSNEIGLLNTLSVTMDVFDTNDGMLGMKLIAPNGDSIDLFTNETLGGTTISVRGITGGNIGENNGFLLGTTFTDSAARSIVDINATGGRGAGAPYVGDYQVENDGFVSDTSGRTLTAFLNKVLQSGEVNGTWQLETIDSNTSASSTPSVVNFWSLNLSTGMKPDVDVQVPGTLGLVLPGGTGTTFTTAAPSTPIGVSPNLVMASDNTLGSFSPYEGRIYAVFVGYYNVIKDGVQNPASNTDIFLTYSDDGGRSWSIRRK